MNIIIFIKTKKKERFCIYNENENMIFIKKENTPVYLPIHKSE